MTEMLSNFISLSVKGAIGLISSFLGIEIAEILSGYPLYFTVMVFFEVIAVAMFLTCCALGALVQFATNDPLQSKFIKNIFLKLEQVNERRQVS